MQARSTASEPTNRAARRAAKRGKATGSNPSLLSLRDGRAGAALTKPAHPRTDYAARRSG